MNYPIHAAVRGSGKNVVVLLHGFGGIGGVWDDVVAHLDGACITIAYDLPGHGLSLDYPKAGSAKVAATAVLADLAARGIDRAHFVGHSMGGAVATLAALFDPERVASLTLLAPGGYGPEINGPLLRRYAAAACAEEIRACLAEMSSPDSTVPETTVRDLAEMRNRPGQTEKLIAFAAAMTAEDKQGVIPRENLATLAMPVMVVWGTDDAVLPYSHADALPSGFLIHHVLEIGHMLPEETPALVADIVSRMVRRRQRRRPDVPACDS
ncbi:alpha/beta fold hydrolase [Aminobacter ciceronei]|uniref:Pyruvate dehydrogenase E2 component (Dihydrolipoamide acetyltransferase) n=1 Tax=Aminobacter ciceronei TaxID=150723 RepID=A0ABR6CGH3_9HYPH|nr:alpha/beta fold hydrolase [Aminobacter ciceronei]MBA8910010.1 pyruvate dehydrogenase E2 component (dihydrolipoamide acetyltransferase) [Aminobacter ciceronei]MBA9023796.1 pyruvate dehydrogenase E2 component (dihydrolipoamide acetyltransferase) [Aminobacter ciceronei]